MPFATKVNWEEVIADHIINNLSNADIAEKYDLDPGYVYQRMRKAKETGEIKRIKKQLEGKAKESRAGDEMKVDIQLSAQETQEPPTVVPQEDEIIIPVPEPINVPESPRQDIMISRLTKLGLTPERAAEIRKLIGSPKDMAIQRQLKSEVTRKMANYKTKHGKLSPAYAIEMKRYQNLDRYRRLGIKTNEIRILAGIRL